MTKIQENTFVSLSTPLGPDVLLLESLRGIEGLSRLFHFELDLLSEDFEVPFNKIVGQPVTVALALHGVQEPRYLHGHFSSFQQLRGKQGLAHYRAELVPWLWFLTQTANCRIFQNQSLPDIITKVCADCGHRDIKNSLEGTYPKLEYCVQYQESDFAFLSRLMEHFGVSYYFEHKKDKHQLVLIDSLAGYPDCPGQARARYKEDDRVVDLMADPGVVTDLQLRQDVRPGKFVHRDYNFERPQQNLETVAKGTIKAGYGAYEVYDYPGKYLVRDDGEALARLRMQALESRHTVVRGLSTCRPFMPGYTFELVGHPRQDLKNKYLLLEVTHDLCAGGYTDEPPRYQNQFAGVPTKDPGMVQLRPPRVTPCPRVAGPQTAVVVGESGEEIYTDKHGRIKVQFHWDRDGKRNQESSCWVRVSQGWAGRSYGAIFLPRIGQEVIVDFLEGDPDQPIVTGAVYNGQQAPPYALPAERSKSTVKTNTYKGEGNNELRFEDKAGSEELFLHAQKDLNEVVGHDHTTTVKNNQVITVTGHQTISVKGEGQSGTQVASQEVKGSALDVTGNAVVNASDNASITAPTSITLTCQGSSVTLEPGKITLTAGGKATIVLDANALMKASGGGTVFLDANAKMNGNGGGTVLLDANAKMNGNGGGTVLLDANAKMNGSGGGTVLLDANAKMNGSGGGTVLLDADAAVTGGEVTAQASGTASVGGAKVSVTGSGTVDIKGGMVQIN